MDDSRASVLHLEFPREHEDGIQITDDDIANNIVPNCPNIETANLTGILDLTDRTLVLLASTALDLRYLDISGCQQVTNVGMLELAAHLTTLEVVKLNHIPLLTDPCISSLVRSLPHLRHLELCDLTLLTAASVRDIWTFARRLRKLKLARCPQLTDKAFPCAFWTSPASSFAYKRLDALPSGDELAGKENIIPRTSATDNLSLPEVRPRPITWLDALPPLILSPIHTLDDLRLLDLGQCWRITDEALVGIVKHAPKIQILLLAGCIDLTDKALDTISRLGNGLRIINLAHLDNLTDRGIVTLVRSCTRLKAVDVSFCIRLTDLSVLELGTLPNLRRLALVNVTSMTDNAILFLAEHTPSLAHLYLSQCRCISFDAFHTLVLKLVRLELLSASGVSALRRKGVKRFSDLPPSGYNKHLQGVFRVFRGNHIDELRLFLDKEQSRLRRAEKQNILFVPRSDDSVDLY